MKLRNREQGSISGINCDLESPPQIATPIVSLYQLRFDYKCEGCKLE